MAESWKQRVRRAANRVLQPFGVHLVRHDRAFEMDGLLGRAAKRGFNIRTWIDVGASDGSWSLQAQRHFPAARYLLFEPLAERQEALERLHQQCRFEIVAAAAGAVVGTVSFAIDPALDGSGVAAPGTGGRSVPVETVDRAVSSRSLPAPYGLKLDTHGFELSVLAGSTDVLTNTELLIIEAYNFKLTPDCLRFHELCTWLETRGFRCCDLADPMRRPSDGVLWQMDLAFARKDHAIFHSNHYE
jgi:FkbM family methyltransferase